MRIIVIGAGHAGIEAALAAARMGARVDLITTHLETVGQMSCNPSIGGIAKGHLVKELDALGGIMPRAADATGIHFKMLNRSKGPAVRATRCQNDKSAYRAYLKRILEETQNLRLYQAVVTGIMLEKDRVVGVSLMEGQRIPADAVVVATGTFLKGRIFIGDTVYSAGRSNEPASIELADELEQLGFRILRLKTGTPMRLHADTIDWSRFEPQPGDENPAPFSLFTSFTPTNKIVCYLGRTSAEVKGIIEDHLHLSPLYSGKISGVGPRYCPSIEDKIVKFPERKDHHFFLEPEGIHTREVYVNGLSTSLPIEVQERILSAIPGLQRSSIMRPAYAVEYDAVDPTQLHPSLQSRRIANLFFAGQVNGTSGYEEAAAQGLMAGLNAVLTLRGRDPVVLGRHEAYIGVLIDDIVHKGVDEPYRLFTSRAEYRLQLREDNAFERLSEYSRDHGLLSPEQLREVGQRTGGRRRMLAQLRSSRVQHEGRKQSMATLLRRPDFNLVRLAGTFPEAIELTNHPSDHAYVEAQIKYEGYIRIQKRRIQRMKRLDRVRIPASLDFQMVAGLSTEVRQKLALRRPATLRQALAIPGVTPAAIEAIRLHLELKRKPT